MSKIKNVWIVMAIILSGSLLISCGPTPEEQTATAVALTAAAPTSTPTITSTRTPTRTPIPTLIPSPTPLPLVMEHIAPGPAPFGFPGLEISEYLETTGAGFNIISPESGSSWTVSYIIRLLILQDLPTDAYLEVHFEDPLDTSRAIVVPLPGPFPGEWNIYSPPLTGVNCKNYWVETHIYSDSAKQTELGRHVQWINANFDIDKVQSVADIAGGGNCSP